MITLPLCSSTLETEKHELLSAIGKNKVTSLTVIKRRVPWWSVFKPFDCYKKLFKINFTKKGTFIWLNDWTELNYVRHFTGKYHNDHWNNRLIFSYYIVWGWLDMSSSWFQQQVSTLTLTNYLTLSDNGLFVWVVTNIENIWHWSWSIWTLTWRCHCARMLFFWEMQCWSLSRSHPDHCSWCWSTGMEREETGVMTPLENWTWLHYNYCWESLDLGHDIFFMLVSSLSLPLLILSMTLWTSLSCIQLECWPWPGYPTLVLTP